MSNVFADEDFKKSSFSFGKHPPVWDCVMIAQTDGAILVRDSKDADKTTLVFTLDEWDAFVKGVKNGEFDFLARIVVKANPAGCDYPDRV